MSCQLKTFRAGLLRVQMANQQASRLARIFKAGHLVQSFHLPNKNSESQRGQVTCQRPNHPEAKSLGHLLCHRPAGSCCFFLHWFLLSKTKVLSCANCVCVFRAKTLPEVCLLNSFSLVILAQMIPPLFLQVKLHFQAERKGMKKQRIP